jgi:hypothetical protein
MQIIGLLELRDFKEIKLVFESIICMYRGIK